MALNPARVATLVTLPVVVVVAALLLWGSGAFHGGAPGSVAPVSTSPVQMPARALTPPVAPTDRVDGLNGVCWYAVTGTTGTQWTTVDRLVPVTVSVPGPPEGSAQSVIPFSAPLAAADPRIAAAPSGCPQDRPPRSARS